MISKSEAVLTRIFDIALVSAAAVLLLIVGVPTPAKAYGVTIVGYYDDYPFFTLDKNAASPTTNELVAYLSVSAKRYRVSRRAGSGDGSTNECTANHGWLPNGVYSNNDQLSASFFTHFNKTWGETVVRGWVWELGDKICSAGTTVRTELFIHSQGTSGWTSSNYASQGCIKLSQVDRSDLHDKYVISYGQSDGFLNVVS